MHAGPNKEHGGGKGKGKQKQSQPQADTSQQQQQQSAAASAEQLLASRVLHASPDTSVESVVQWIGAGAPLPPSDPAAILCFVSIPGAFVKQWLEFLVSQR